MMAGMIRGAIVAESLRLGAVVEGVPLQRLGTPSGDGDHVVHKRHDAFRRLDSRSRGSALEVGVVSTAGQSLRP
jgi:hypothetical protein